MLYRLFAFLQLVSHIPYPAHVSLCSSLLVISCFHRMHVSLSFYLSFSTSLYHNHFGHDITHVSERYYRFWSFDASSLIDPDPESAPDGLRLPWTILHTEAWWLTVSLSCLDSQQELEFVKCIPIEDPRNRGHHLELWNATRFRSWLLLTSLIASVLVAQVYSTHISGERSTFVSSRLLIY